MSLLRGAGVAGSGFVVMDAVFNGFQLLLGLSGEMVGMVFLFLQLDTLVNPDFAVYIRYPLLFLSVLYLIYRLDRFYNSLRREANGTT